MKEYLEVNSEIAITFRLQKLKSFSIINEKQKTRYDCSLCTPSPPVVDYATAYCVAQLR